jgi:hypothetical protein
MLEKMIAARDPVITSGGGMLRFEGFSACCSAYARVDISPDSYRGEILGVGTTNVDFNSTMKSALSSIRDDEKIEISIGAEKMALTRGVDSIVEKKVNLPVRWLKGFVEVQSYQSSMEHRFTINKVETIRFLRSVPNRCTPRSTFWVIQSGKGLRFSQTPLQSNVKISGLNRLLILKQLAPFADELTIFADPRGEASEWQLRCGAITFTLSLTAESRRGFSGEGQALIALADAPENQIAQVRACLKWQSIVSVFEISKHTQLTEVTVKQLLSVLGTRGLVGFDLRAGAYFHREMPFDLEQVEHMQPRLKAARLLVANGLVSVLPRNSDMNELEVQGTEVKHLVKLGQTGNRCTCQWYSKYQGLRGPCKHIIASVITLRGDDGEE